MWDGWWNGELQKMKYSLGVPKGMRVTPQERGIDTREIVANHMREILASRNFQNEKSRIEWFLVEDKGQLMYMLPKFHCELNHIEQVWALEKLLEHNSRFGNSRKYAETFQDG